MKQLSKILAFLLVSALLMATLVSCATVVSGNRYESEIAGFHTTLTFTGSNKVTLSYHVHKEQETDEHGHVHYDAVTDEHGHLQLVDHTGEYDGQTVKGKYQIEGNQITITFDSDDMVAQGLNGTHSFEQLEKGIRIAGVTYTQIQ